MTEEIRDRLTKQRLVKGVTGQQIAVGPTPRKPRHQGAFCLTCSRGALFSYDWAGRDRAVAWGEAHVCPAIAPPEAYVDPDPPF